MKVAIDARKVDDFGIGTYIQGLLEALPAVGQPEALVAYLPTGRAPDVPTAAAWGARPLASGLRRRLFLRELWQLAPRARRDRVDLTTPHYVCPPWLPVSGGRDGARSHSPGSRCGTGIPSRRSTRA
jgi:hypothetical protein